MPLIADSSPVEPTMSLTEDLPSTPQISQDEGYDHGVSIDSMIITPRVPTLSEQAPNIGTSTNADLNKIHQNKMYVLRHAASMV